MVCNGNIVKLTRSISLGLIDVLNFAIVNKG